MSNEIRPEDIRRIAAAKERQVLGEEGLRRFLQPGTTLKGDPPPLDPVPSQPNPQPAAMPLPRRATMMPRGPYDDEVGEPEPLRAAPPPREPLRSEGMRAEPPVSYDEGDEDDGPTRFRPEDFADYDVETVSRPPIWRRYLPMAVGVFALIGFAGVVLYAYDWSGSDGPVASGEAPIIRADAEPVKVKPSDTGGEMVANQDSTVLNPEVASGTTEVLMPPPEEPSPVAISETQVASTAPAVPAAPPAPPTVAIAPAAPTPSVSETTTSAIPPAPPPPPAPATVTTEAAPAPAPAVEVASASTTAAVQPDATGGAYLIQLASLTEEGAVPNQWAKLQAKYPDLLSDMGLKITPAVVNGTQYYRLQAGPLPNKATAEDMCAQLKSLQQDCLIVKN